MRVRAVRRPGVEEAGSLAAAAPHVTEMDLQKNLLSDWTDICSLADEFPQMVMPLPPSSLLSRSFSCLLSCLVCVYVCVCYLVSCLV